MQEQIEITTPITKKKVVLRGYITGRIKREIEGIIYGAASVTAGRDDVKIDGSVIAQSEMKAFELIILSIDGSTENVVDAFLDLPAEDYTFIKKKIDEVQSPLASEPAKS